MQQSIRVKRAAQADPLVIASLFLVVFLLGAVVGGVVGVAAVDHVSDSDFSIGMFDVSAPVVLFSGLSSGQPEEFRQESPPPIINSLKSSGAVKPK